MSNQPIPADDYQASPEQYAANAARHARDAVDECFLCGRGLTERTVATGWSIHLLTDGTLAPADQDVADPTLDQGWFPVGSECARRLPATHRARPATPARLCNHEVSDGNRDDPGAAYCGHPHAHAGDHGNWRV